jgi:ATP-binding cassette subfamily F protein 3
LSKINLNDQLKKIETDISEFESQVKVIESEIADEKTYSDSSKLTEANKRYQAAKNLLDTAQTTWEDLASDIMELEGK